jgi:hypothetical protein
MRNPPVKLSDVVEYLSLVSDNVGVYLNKRTGEFVVLASDDLLGFEDDDDYADADNNIEPDWLEEYDDEFKREHRLRREILNSDDYIPLPDKADIHEWQIMDDFCRKQSPRIGEQLARLIKGRGAFGRFQNAINALAFENKWFLFRDQAYERIAREWMESYEIAFIDEDRSLIANLQKREEVEPRSAERMQKTPERNEFDGGKEGGRVPTPQKRSRFSFRIKTLIAPSVMRIWGRRRGLHLSEIRVHCV